MNNPRLIAFYLPQYHTIPENDKWWGKGFTDWTNVKKGRPRFWGHYQPHIPGELGYYDLKDEKVRIAQAEMARKYGISGFCYYHYWFNEKMLLEKPFNEVLESGKPDFPFCLCWANENWTRRWDGCENEILIEQDYSKYDAEKHIKWLANAFKDGRYIKVHNKPLFLIYKADSIPGIKEKIDIWRNTAKKCGIEDIFICSVKSYHNKLSDEESKALGFNAMVDFIPTPLNLPKRKVSSLPRYVCSLILYKILNKLGVKSNILLPSVTSVYSYKKIAHNLMNQPLSNILKFPCIIPGWDNSARRKQNSAVIQNSNSELYKKWLSKTFEKINSLPADEQIIFINAWNEWAEGCHLEPDLKNGNKFLEATLKIRNNGSLC
jgi:lipopolysaccharide biosynthesis protein